MTKVQRGNWWVEATEPDVSMPTQWHVRKHGERAPIAVFPQFYEALDFTLELVRADLYGGSAAEMRLLRRKAT
jgi:hypothetical protein